MAVLPRQEISQTGITPTLSAADVAGDTFANDDRTFLVIDNADAGSHTATIAVQRTPLNIGNLGEITFAAIAIAVPAGQRRYVKVPAAPYNDGDGKVHVTYDAVTSVTVGVFRAPPA